MIGTYLNIHNLQNSILTKEIDDGYGEFVVVNPVGKVTKETHDAA